VVADEKAQRELAQNILKKLNYTVATVSSGEKAVEYVRKSPPDLIILDMIMDPGMDGFDTYKQIKGFNRNQKAIIASGYSETDRVKKAQTLGAGEYLKKPYTIEKIGMAIKTELNKP